MNDIPVIRPTRERMKMAPGYDELTETQAGGVVKKTGALRLWTPLENLYRNGLLTPHQYDAAKIFYLDWDKSHKGGRVIVNYGEHIASFGIPSDLDGVERRVFHSRRFTDANRILEELDTRRLVHWFVINDIPCEAIGRKYWGYRDVRTASASARASVAISLQRLAKFYGLVR
jgi:hypothetical protein